MIRYSDGDLFESGAEVLVNPVNCVGVSGKGLALLFRNLFPSNHVAYAAACQTGELCPGTVFVFKTQFFSQPIRIINFPTKRHWRDKSYLEDIASGLMALVDELEEHPASSIAIPQLGCGLGGLPWRDVRASITNAMSHLDTDVILFGPPPSPGRDVKDATVESWNETRGAIPVGNHTRVRERS